MTDLEAFIGVKPQTSLQQLIRFHLPTVLAKFSKFIFELFAQYPHQRKGAMSDKAL